MGFNIQATIGADGSGFFREMNRVKAAAKDVSMSALGGFGVPLGAAAAAGAITALAYKTVEYGSKINDMSARLGISTDALQEFDYAMTLNGATLDDAASAMQRLGSARQSALSGDSESMDAFRALGISAEQLKSAKLEDLFKAVGRSVRDAADVQTVLGDAFKVMGKGAGNVLAAMRADLEAAGEEAQRLGLIIGADTIAKLDELGDSADTTGKRMMASFAPALTFLMEGVNTAIDGFKSIQAIVNRTFEMWGAMLGGQSRAEALAEADAGIDADLSAIGEAQETRRAGRTTAPRGGAALGFAGEGAEGKSAAREAEKILSLREKIAKLDRDALPEAERRAALEAEVTRLRQEQANLAANGLDEAKQLELELQARGLEKELAGMDGKKSAPDRPDVDSLARRGIFVGGSPVGVRTTPLTGAELQREVTRLAQSIAAENAKVVDAVNKTARATKEVLG